MLEKLIAFSFAFAILGQAWLVRIHTRTWFSPSCIYGLFWFAYTAIPLVAVPFVSINALAIVYIFFTCLLFSLPVFLFNWRLAIAVNIKFRPKFDNNSNLIRRSFYILGCSAIFATLLNWGLQGFSYYEIFFNLLETSGEYMSRRYSDTLQSNVVSQLSFVLSYSAAVFGGMLYGSRVKKSDNGLRYLLIASTSSILMMLVEAAKGTFFLVLVLFWSGSLLAKINYGKIDKLVETKIILRMLIWLPLLIVLLGFSFLARGVDTESGGLETLNTLYYYFLSYSSGHLYAFADWFSSVTTGGAVLNYHSIEGSSGFYTFMALFKLIGTEIIAPPGVYDEYYQLGEILKTNIYTHYRGLILDFGLAGSLLAMFVAGVISHMMFYFLLLNKKPWIAASFFAHLIGYIYTSFIVSILIWNSIFASFMIVALILFINVSHSRIETQQLRRKSNE